MANKLEKNLEDIDQEEQSAAPISIAENVPLNEEPDLAAQMPIDQTAPAPVSAPTLAPTPQAAPLAAPTPQMAIPLPPKPPTAQDYNAHDIAEWQDAATRKITPQTYATMFADKSTLGKIGSLFGLMLSGAGSGLAHQSNALLDMMNKVIDNDLNAQKSNVSNAQNFLNLTYAHDLQQAQIRASDYENAMKQYHAQTVPSAIRLTEAQTEQAKAGTQAQKAQTAGLNIANKAAELGLSKKKFEATLFDDINNPGNKTPGVMPAAGQSLAPQTPGQQSTQNSMPPLEDIKAAGIAAPFRTKNRMLTAIGQYLGNSVANNPQGKAVFQNQILPVIQAEQAKNNQQAEAAQRLSVPEIALQDDPMVDDNRFNQMVKVGRQMPDAPPSVAIPPADASLIMGERQALKQNRQMAYDYVNKFKNLQLLKNAGQIPVSQLLKAISGTAGAGLGALLTSLIGQPIVGGIGGASLGEGVGAAIQNAYERERTALIGPLEQQLGVKADSILPNYYDTDKSANYAFNSGMNLFKYKDSGLGQVMSNYGLKANFPNIPYQEPLLQSTKSDSEKKPQKNEKNNKKERNLKVSGPPDILKSMGY